MTRKIIMAATLTAMLKDEQQSFGWDVFDHVAYSPDLLSLIFMHFLAYMASWEDGGFVMKKV